jgi:exopolysaccharide biosynthesis polyprenyl glycosylphosphotransferase
MSTVTNAFAVPLSVPIPTSAPSVLSGRVAASGRLGAWRCQIVCADAFIARVEGLFALGIACLGLAHPALIGGSVEQGLGAVTLLAACRVAFYAVGGQKLLVAQRLACLRGLIRSVVLALGASWLFFSAWPRLAPGATVAFWVVVSSSAAFVCLSAVTQQLVRSRLLVEECLILGTPDKGGRFLEELLAAHRKDVLPADESGDGLIDYAQIKRRAVSGELSRIVVAGGALDGNPELSSLLIDCKLRGTTVEHAIDSYERLCGKIWVEGLRPEWLIYSPGFQQGAVYLVVKRALDIVTALALLAVTGPVMLLVAAAIKLESPGPAVFAQERVGHHGRPFTLYKFRSMRHDAEAKSGPVWAGEADARVTPLGRVIRKCRLDELPQVINVLRGQMSFVGPRPERPYFVDILGAQIPSYQMRHYVLPGITGWAQVKYPYGASMEDAYQKLQYDLYYSKHGSLRLDLLILLKTIEVVLMGRGAR